MNILFVSHSGKRSGGAQNVLLSVMVALQKDGVNCHCLFSEPGPFLEEVKGIGIHPHVVKFKWWAGFEADTYYKVVDCLLNFRLSIDPVVKIIKDNKINIVVSNTVTMAEGALAARLSGIPHVWYIHEILSRDPKLKHMLRLDFLYPNMEMLSETMVVVSNAVRREIEMHLGRPSAKIQVIYNGVVPESNDFDRQHNNLVVSAGGVCRRKGQMTLLRAARLVCDEIPDAIFQTAGKFWETQYRRELIEERNKLGMSGKFHFMKWIHDMKSFYRSGEVFATASTCEAFGLVLLEAMNNGLPVVSTDSGGPTEIIEDGETGYLVPVDNHQRLADKIIYLLKNKEFGDQMGIKGYNRVTSFFSHDEFIERFSNMIGEIKYGNS